ncbi:MAG: hypothetical protein GY929_07890 [Actinomycetia bacterium]|nr:hypothetical protein [Actinomycetes bacterium]
MAVHEKTRRCTCGTELVEIEIEVNGHDVIMVSCATCDSRSWLANGHPVPLDGVLAGIGSSSHRRRS